jgi:hypothetical protein
VLCVQAEATFNVAAPIEDENSVPQSALQGETLRWLES